MLLAVSGSQGSGKSTVLAELESRGFKVLKRKISRSILSDWGVTLDEVNDDVELTLKFQDEIIVRKNADELEAVSSPEVYFTERTYMDSVVYYLFSFGKFSTFDEKITEYTRRCEKYNNNYAAVFYLPAGMFSPVNDGVRATNPYYVESVDVVLHHYLRKTMSDRLYCVESLAVNERADFIQNVIKSMRSGIDIQVPYGYDLPDRHRS